MGLFDKIFGVFKHKEVVNEETVTEKVINNDESPIIVNDTTNAPVMVRADDFQDSSVAPEEYKVAESDDEVEEVIEETVDHGIDVSEGDDMTPIIMDVEESIETVEEVIEPVEDVPEVIETIEDTPEVIEETLDVVDEVPEVIETIEENTEVEEVIEPEEILEEDIEIL